MQIQNWKIFDKNGSPLNWQASPYIPLQFSSVLGTNAEGFLVTNVSTFVESAKILNGGYNYITSDTVSYDYLFDNAPVTLTPIDVSIILTDVSIFNPNPTNSLSSIKGLNLNIDASFVYPAVTYGAAVFLTPVSQQLVETQQLYIFEEPSAGTFIRPYDASNSTLIFRMAGDDSQIQFFTVDETTAEITWTNELIFDTSLYTANIPIIINIGFKADNEGVYEQIIRIYHQVGNLLYTMADIAVSAESIGEDERFRALLGNFGLPDPKDFPKLFKEVDINEDLLDWKVLNQKSKHMILEHNNIMPYVGTYKGLINAIKWLGYDDIYIREWFLNVKDNTKLSLIVPYDATDRLQTILTFSADARKHLKKLNQLSLNYCITRETGEIDDYGTPITEDCYSYSLDEVFAKLLSLKQWLERNIIGINCRIVDITGEGIYFERIQNLVYETDNIGYNYAVNQNLTPYAVDESSELITGDASIRLSILELTEAKLYHLPRTFADLVEGVWNPYDPSAYIKDPCTGVPFYTYTTLTDPSYLANPERYLLIGPHAYQPLQNISDVMWKLSVEKENGVIGETMVTNPLFIHENEIRFYNIFDVSSVFYDVSTSLTVYLESGYLRDPSIDEWEYSIAYTIYPNPHLYLDASVLKTIVAPTGTYIITSGTGTISTYIDSSVAYNVTYDPISFEVDASVTIITDTPTVISTPGTYDYYMESSTGAITMFDDYITFNPDTNSLLQYAVDSNYNVPLLSMKNYKYTDASGITYNFGGKEYYLDIIDGKIEMNAGTVNNTSDNYKAYINWNYDTSLEEQMITMNVEYTSPRMKLSQFDPSTYYWADPSGLTGGNDASMFIWDNNIYSMKVNHIGDYHIELFAWDAYNTLFYNTARELYSVWVKHPTLYTLIDNCCNVVCVSTCIPVNEVSTLISQNKYPIYDRVIPLQGLNLEYDSGNKPYIKVPSITYFQDVPEPGSINRFYNLTERVLTILDSSITIDPDYQAFYVNDNIKLVKFDKGKYEFIAEVSSYIIDVSQNNTLLTLDNIPSNIFIDSSSSVYIINDTYRSTANPSNNYTNNQLSIDINGYVFGTNQVVGLIVTDLSTNYSWGASYRVLSVNGSTHSFDKILPQQFVDNTGKYNIEAKHAFSSYSNLTIDTSSATEVNNEFKIYLKDSHCQEYYLDDTFTYINIPFDQEIINSRWYDPSLNLVNGPFYFHKIYVAVDINTLTLLRALYDPSNYMLNQKNIWTARSNDTGYLVFRVFNLDVPIVFGAIDNYIIDCESYDSYGNLIKTL